MKRKDFEFARLVILKKKIDDKRMDKVIKYLNTKYMPDDIGVLFNRSFEYEKYKISGCLFFKKFLHLVFVNSTVESITGDGIYSRRGVTTYPSHVFAFEDEQDAKMFCNLSNIIENRDSYKIISHTDCSSFF